MIPLTFLYDEYIDRPKFTEQKKKNPFEYIVPSPTSGVGTINVMDATTSNAKMRLFVDRSFKRRYHHYEESVTISVICLLRLH